MNRPAHPGKKIKDELAKRGWAQADLIYVLGCSPKTLSLIVNGKQNITPSMSKALGAAFGLDAQHFADLQLSFDLLDAPEPDPGLHERAQIQSEIPVREMIRRGWLSDNSKDLKKDVLSLLGENSETPKHKLPFAAKRTDTLGAVSKPQLAWISRVRQIAKGVYSPNLKKKDLQTRLSDLEKLLGAPEEVRHVPRILSECGVRLVIVEPIQGAKIDGVCTWLSSREPVIGMSMRFDRIDNFWFVLRHEIEHVLKGEGKNSDIGMIDKEVESVDQDITTSEREANSAAAEFCVPQEKMNSFVRRKQPFFHEKDVLAFSRRNQRHPGLVVGQLQHQTGRWGYLKRYQEAVRSHILPSALVDGYGCFVPVE